MTAWMYHDLMESSRDNDLVDRHAMDVDVIIGKEMEAPDVDGLSFIIIRNPRSGFSVILPLIRSRTRRGRNAMKASRIRGSQQNDPVYRGLLATRGLAFERRVYHDRLATALLHDAHLTPRKQTRSEAGVKVMFKRGRCKDDPKTIDPSFIIVWDPEILEEVVLPQLPAMTVDEDTIAQFERVLGQST